MIKKPLKRLSIFFILFFFIFALGFAHYNYQVSTFDNVPFLIQNTYQIFSINRTLSTVFICKDTNRL
jgi:hypothetical protein